MQLTPAIKGQLTKASKAVSVLRNGSNLYHNILSVFVKHMPREQAKHATRKYLSTINI